MCLPQRERRRATSFAVEREGGEKCKGGEGGIFGVQNYSPQRALVGGAVAVIRVSCVDGSGMSFQVSLGRLLIVERICT